MRSSNTRTRGTNIVRKKSSAEPLDTILERAWHTMDAEKVLQFFHVDERGLSSDEVSKRLTIHGPNAFTETPPTPWWVRVVAQLRSPLTLVLVVAAIVTLLLQEYVDAGVITFALAVAVVIGVLQEGRASKAFAALSHAQVKRVTVTRDGVKTEIRTEKLVPGDVVELQAGVQVPADVRVIMAHELATNEAALTGEWSMVRKEVKKIKTDTPLAEQSAMAFMGTFVAEGYGRGVVVATGDDTEMGKVASSLQDVVEEKTPLQHEMEKVSQLMFYTIIGIVALIFIIGLIYGQSLTEMLLVAIAVAVASIPEGLPAAVTIILAIGMESLLKRGGLVRNLLAAETLGSTTYVLTDKTGTLTEARMAVVGLGVGEEVLLKKAWKKSKLARLLFDVSLAATDAYIDGAAGTKQKPVIHGDSVERAIVEQATKLGLGFETDSLRSARLDYEVFTSERRFAMGLSKRGKGGRLVINGAPELLLEKAAKVQTETGVKQMTKERRAQFAEQIAQLASEGKRLIGVGYKDVSGQKIGKRPERELKDLVFLGIVVLHDPIRSGVIKAIKGVQQAGARVILVTGDNPKTAASVAKTTGIYTDDVPNVYTGTDLEKMDESELSAALESSAVFARVLPKQKLRLVTLLQKQGEIVAMTGDGINDGPALKRANIGVAVGSGTAVAKESSDLVLVNDTFATIYAAIEEGRRIIANLRKIVGYLISTSLSEVVLIGAALLIGAPVPLVPAQILWANMIEEGLMSVAFAFEPGSKNAMKNKPHDVHGAGILTRDMISFLILVVVVLGSMLVGLYFFLYYYLQLPTDILRSVMFLAISIDSLFLAFSFRSLSRPVWQIPFWSNIFFLVSFLVNAALLAIVISVPWFQFLLSYTPLPWYLVTAAVIYAVTAFATVEVLKWQFFSRFNTDRKKAA